MKFITHSKQMKTLVIPDVHLKPWMFIHASEIMHAHQMDIAVCLMDIADDWDQQNNLELYNETYDAAIRFAKEFPSTLWCIGNHDISYVWNRRESGYSPSARTLVMNKMQELRKTLPSDGQMAFVHRLDNVIFCHGGILSSFVEEHVNPGIIDDIDLTIRAINQLGPEHMWRNDSPIWARPQYMEETLYKHNDIWQVVGHTPISRIMKSHKLISCDVFSTYPDGKHIGSQEFLLLDTKNMEFSGIRYKNGV